MKEKLAEEYAESFRYKIQEDGWKEEIKKHFIAGWEAKEASMGEADRESELVEEILQKFEQIGIDTSEWEYKFGDGNFAADFIKLGVQSYLDSLNSPLTKSEASIVGGEVVGLTSIELLTALLRGDILERYGELSEKESFWCEWDNGKPYFFNTGWGSALGTKQDRIMSLIEHPELWQIEKISPLTKGE